MADFHFSPRPNRAAEIHWRPWEEAAFEEARTRDKPILLSISAVWCHWCHVMDETTYSDQRVIDLLNRDYVPVRVGNDLRPDINGRYNMGGWPTTAFLTPQGDILSGGTYLPADQMVGALVDIERFYHLRKPEVVARVLEAKKRTGAVVASSAGSLDAGLIDGVLQAVENAYDATYGGFGSAPKFPQVDALLLLAEQAAIRGRPELRELAVFTLRQMGAGRTLRGPPRLHQLEREPGHRLPGSRRPPRPVGPRGRRPKVAGEPVRAQLPGRRRSRARRGRTGPAGRPGLGPAGRGARLLGRS